MKRKKKYKLKLGRIIIATFILITVILVSFNAGNIITYIELKTLNYNNTSIKLIKENELSIDKYSKTLDTIIKTEYFDKNNVKYYIEIEYSKDNNFFETINKLIDIGYNSEEINTIYNKNIDTNLITTKEYNKNILKIINSDYYKEENLERYFNYESDNIVLDVNMFLDYEFYNHDIQIDKVDNLVIVNKYYKLDKNYVPELVKVNSKYALNDKQQLTKETNEAFEKMCEDAKKQNINLYSGSGYRSYSYQDTLYNDRVKKEGQEYADKTAAKAGYSEHQTGMAIDITKNKTQNGYLEETDKEFEWLMENSYKYGFILRYPKGKEHITGYAYEPWHFRYINIEVATILKEKNIIYEEYMGMQK